MAKDQSAQFSAPGPPVDSAAEGVKWSRGLAQQYLPQSVTLCAAVAFGRHDASMWVRLQAVRLLTTIAGIGSPEAIPEGDLQQGSSDGTAGGGANA